MKVYLDQGHNKIRTHGVQGHPLPVGHWLVLKIWPSCPFVTIEGRPAQIWMALQLRAPGRNTTYLNLAWPSPLQDGGEAVSNLSGVTTPCAGSQCHTHRSGPVTCPHQDRGATGPNLSGIVTTCTCLDPHLCSPSSSHGTRHSRRSRAVVPGIPSPQEARLDPAFVLPVLQYFVYCNST